MPRTTRNRVFGAGFVLLTFGCSSDPPPLTKEQLLDPQSCAGCHPTQFRQWSGSMHAYAGDDPVFTAMNARFQREQGGSLCVQCHAPVAFAQGASLDGTNLASLPASMRGVTCFVCHSASSISADHNQGLVSSDDGVMRGPIADPAHGAAHGSTYSKLHDLDQLGSSALCGSCHDVQNGHGFDVERTFAEWSQSLYAKPDPKVQQTCSACHMTSSLGQAASTEGAPSRRIHDHSMAALDVALTPFPETAAQTKAVQAALDASIAAKLCVDPPQGTPNVTVTLDNAFVGHEFPSGAAHDRRVWVELVAYAAGQVVFSSGVVQPGQPVTSLSDPALWLLRNQLQDEQQQPVTFLWQAFGSQPSLLPAAVTNDPQDPAYYHSVSKTYLPPPETDRITMRVRAVPIGLDVLQDLVASGDLDPSYVSVMPTFELSGTVLEWNKTNGYGCVP